MLIKMLFSLVVLGFPCCSELASSATDSYDIVKIARETRRKIVLSVDGGGIRGIIPAVILAELEKRLHSPIAKHIDVFGGTSTGGVIAAALNVPATATVSDQVKYSYGPEYGHLHPKFSAQDLVNLYTERGPEIFKKRRFSALKSSKYSREGLDNILLQHFGSVPMSASIKPLLLTSYDISRATPYLLRSMPVRSERSVFTNNPQFLLRDAVAATSAAPTYFDPVKIWSLLTRSQPSQSYTFVDGGMYANNPVLPTVEYARKLDPLTPIERYVVVSLGTGEMNQIYPYGSVRNWISLQWIQPAINIMMDGSSDLAHMMAESLLGNSYTSTGSQYFRLNKPLSVARHAMDDCSSANIENLKHEAHMIMHRNEDAITNLLRYMDNNKS